MRCFSRILIIYSTYYYNKFRPLKTGKGAKLTKTAGFYFQRKQKKIGFCYRHYVMSVTKLLLALIYEVHPFWKKKTYQQVHLCIEFKKFSSPGEILGRNMS